MAKLELFPLEKILTYDNYRILLKDLFDKKKSENQNFSYRSFARTAGFNSHSFCEFVLKGKRNLTLESIQKMVKGLELDKKPSEYFKVLVQFNQAKTLKDRQKFFKELIRLRRTAKFYKLQEEQYKYYSEWYYPIVRELVVYSNWKGNYKTLAALVRPKITPDQARKAFQFLLEKKFLIKNAGNKFSQSDPVISAEGIPEHLVSSTKTEYLLRAAESLESQSRPERHIATSTLAMSKKTYQEVSQLLGDIRKKILVSAAEDEQVDEVYALNIQLFPLTNMNTESKSKEI